MVHYIDNQVVEQKSEQKTFITTPTYTAATTGGTLTLTAESGSVHFITGAVSNFSVVMPNATTLSKGVNFEIYNRTSSSIVIKYSDGSTLGVLAAEAVSSLILQDNTTAKGMFSPFTVEIAQAAGILNFSAESQTTFATSSLTYVQVTPGATLIPSSGQYAIFFNSSNVSTLNNAECSISLYKNTTPIAGTERTARSTASNFILQLSTQGIASFNGTDELRVYAKVTTGTLNVNARSVVMLRLGGEVA